LVAVGADMDAAAARAAAQDAEIARLQGDARDARARLEASEARAAAFDAQAAQLAELQQKVEVLSATELAFRLRAVEAQRQVEAEGAAALRARIEELEASHALQVATFSSPVLSLYPPPPSSRSPPST